MVGNKSRSKNDQGLSISAASKITGIEIHTLRYWEKEFSEFLFPGRSEGGQRRYRPEEIQTVFVIKRLLREEMFSIAGARKHIEQRLGKAA